MLLPGSDQAMCLELLADSRDKGPIWHNASSDVGLSSFSHKTLPVYAADKGRGNQKAAQKLAHPPAAAPGSPSAALRPRADDQNRRRGHTAPSPAITVSGLSPANPQRRLTDPQRRVDEYPTTRAAGLAQEPADQRAGRDGAGSFRSLGGPHAGSLWRACR